MLCGGTRVSQEAGVFKRNKPTEIEARKERERKRSTDRKVTGSTFEEEKIS